jgi:hypothetical protein
MSAPVRPGWWSVSLRALGPRVAGAVLFRYVCFVIMLGLSLWAEGRPAPHLPDLLLDRLPYLPLLDRYNHWLLTLAYIPLALALLWVDAPRFVRYNVTSGLLSLLRGLCIVATGLGPVRGEDVHAGLLRDAAGRPSAAFWQALGELSTPGGLFGKDAAHVYLSKDLFFSGHTGVTFLLLLYVWRLPALRGLMLIGHLLVVASVLLAHLHYTIDIVGAYAIAFALFALREGWPPPRRRAAAG